MSSSSSASYNAVFRLAPVASSALGGFPPPRVEVRAIPKPKAGAGELLVRVAFSALQGGDMMWLAGVLKMPKEMNENYAGVSAAGVVESAGDSSLNHYVGQSVMMYRALDIQPNNVGMWSEYAIIVPTQCAIIPRSAVHAAAQALQMSSPTADTVSALKLYSGSLCNIFTALAFLQDYVLPPAGSSASALPGVIITAGASATGRALLALCARHSVRTVAIVRSVEAADSLRHLHSTLPRKPEEGKDFWVLHEDSADFSKEATAAITAAHATVVFDCVTGKLLSTLIPCLLVESKIVVYQALDRVSPVSFPGLMIMMKRLVLRNFTVFRSGAVGTTSSLQAALKEVSELLGEAPEHCFTSVGKVFAVKEAEDAVKEAALKYVTKKVILDFTSKASA